MKALWSGFGAAVIVVALTVPAAAVAAPTTVGRLVPTAALAKAVRMDPPAPPVSPMLREMLDRVNAERSARGLAPMRYDDRLVLAAQGHSEDQAHRGQMGHTGSDGSRVGVRVDRVGYAWRSVSENVADGHPYWTQVFASPG